MTPRANLTFKEKVQYVEELLKEFKLEHDIFAPADIVRVCEEMNYSPIKYKDVVRIIGYAVKRSRGEDRATAVLSIFPNYKDKKTKYITNKAYQIEHSKIYKAIISTFSLSLHAIFFFDRVKVLSEALELALDPCVPIKYRHNYMKVFLEETRKEEGGRELEININVGQQQKEIEQRIEILAKKVEGSNVKQLMDMLDDNSKKQV